MLRHVLTATLAIVIAGATATSSHAQNNEDVGAVAARWDGGLTGIAEKRILAEIDALGKRARGRLSEKELAVVDAKIEYQLKLLRDWAKNKRFRSESKPSIGPLFTEFIRKREKGTDIRRAPIMSIGAGIARVHVGSERKQEVQRFEASFLWTSADSGRFVEEWAAEKPVDEEYQVQVSGQLRLLLRVEVPNEGKIIRVKAETNKLLFKRHPLVLKAAQAEIRQPVNK